MKSFLLISMLAMFSAPAYPMGAMPNPVPGVVSMAAPEAARADDSATVTASATETATATATATDPEVVPPVTQQDLDNLWQSIGGLKGASAAFIAYFIAQILMMLLKSQLGYKFTAGWQLTAVYGMTVVLSVLGLVVMGGLSWGAALVHSQTVTAFSVLFNQVLKKTGINA